MAANIYSCAEETAESEDDRCHIYMKCLHTDEESTYDNITVQRSKNESASLEYYTSIYRRMKDEGIVKERVESLSNKRFICILVLVAAVALAASVCLVAVFVKVAALESKSTNSISAVQSQISSTSEDIANDWMLHLQQLNYSLTAEQNSDMETLFNILQLLNYSLTSLDERVMKQTLEAHNTRSLTSDNLTAIDQEIVSLQSRASQLNESIDDLYQMLEKNSLLLNSYYTPSQTSITSCAALPPSFPSDYYWVRVSNDSAVRVYCDMTRSCGGITGGWTRVAGLDTTSNGHQCPSGLTQRTDGNILTCVRDTSTAGCSSVTLQTESISYSKVCGKITGYQIGTTDGFSVSSNINSFYLDGVSLTHGNPRQHIWSFAVGFNRAVDQYIVYNCPCQHPSARQPPSFVGIDYFCDTGNEQRMYMFKFYPVPLWTDASCLCCTNPPWFHKQLPQPTTDDIEMRVCRDEANTSEDIAIQEVEIYVQ